MAGFHKYAAHHEETAIVKPPFPVTANAVTQHIESDLVITYPEDNDVRVPKDAVRRRWMASMLFSSTFKTANALVMVGNLFLVVIETNLRAKEEFIPVWLRVSTLAIIASFVVEILLRLWISGWDFFKTGTNIFDMVVVCLDALLEVFSSSMDYVPTVSVLRMFRVVRALKGLRIFWSCRELYMMMFGFFGSMRAIAWASLVIYAMVIIWSVIFVDLVHPINKNLDHGDCERCPRAFESVSATVLTITQQIIAGDSWGLISVPVIEEAPWTWILFVPCLLSVQLGLMNLVLAVIVDTAEQARADDLAYKLSEKSNSYIAAREKLLSLCRAMDVDKGGTLTLEELRNGFDGNEEFRTQLKLMDIQEDDLTVVFAIMDSDKSGSIEYEEFVRQLHKMKSEDQQTVLAFLKYYVKEIRSQVDEQMKVTRADIVLKADERDRFLHDTLGGSLDDIKAMINIFCKNAPAHAEDHEQIAGQDLGGRETHRILTGSAPAHAQTSKVQQADTIHIALRKELARLQDIIRSELMNSISRVDNAYGCQRDNVGEINCAPEGGNSILREAASGQGGNARTAFARSRENMPPDIICCRVESGRNNNLTSSAGK